MPPAATLPATIAAEIAQLREKLAKRESEEESLLASMATQEKDLARLIARLEEARS